MKTTGRARATRAAQEWATAAPESPTLLPGYTGRLLDAA